MILLRAPAGATGLKFGDREYLVDRDGEIEVPEEAFAVAKSHGYYLAKDGPAKAPVDPATSVSIPKPVFFDGLKALGIVLVDATMPQDKLIEAFTEGCKRQDERLRYEMSRNDRAHAERLDDEIKEAEARGAELALKQLADADAGGSKAGGAGDGDPAAGAKG